MKGHIEKITREDEINMELNNNEFRNIYSLKFLPTLLRYHVYREINTRNKIKVER